ncbi:MAG: Si-specific NAD(P)(+) transhydrogenase [Zetaproteobacteria bacterium]|nr:Si-specific NAD(P)(+) transhydrogenase [Pseudobdellovibrionaceae bacterium]
MTAETLFDLIIVGSGPGGEGAAMQAAKEGLKVALVEKSPMVGGSCTHLGTIPSKSLRQMSHLLTIYQDDLLFNRGHIFPDIGFSDFLSRAKDVIAQQVARRQSHYFRNRIRLFQGLAEFRDKNSIYLHVKGKASEVLRAKNFILAVGSAPYQPPEFDFNHKNIFDSDSILSMNFTPRHMVIYGAGAIGCEYTSIFRALGTKVTLINTRSSLLSFLDEDISNALTYHFRDKGVHVLNNERIEDFESCGDFLSLRLHSGKSIKTDVVLVTVGRTGCVENLGLTKLGVLTDDRQYIKVNEHYQTNIDNIYAVGDITGFPCLASAAYDQGRFAALHLINPMCDDSLVKDIPLGIYTSPEISCIGKSEKELTEARVSYEMGAVSFKHLARAQIKGETAGMLKILFDKETLQILGIHCFGQSASEIIHIGQSIMAQKGEANSMKYFVNTTFNYPTMAEAYRVAALNGLNRLKFN